MKRLVEGLKILAKYDADAEICAEHDVIHVCVDRNVVSPEDTVALKTLGGWHVDGNGTWAMFT
jgi:hypothetical protein